MFLVLRARVELARLTAQASKTCAATNYAISARLFAKNQANIEFIFFGNESLARHFQRKLFRQIFAFIFFQLAVGIL